MSSKTVDPVTMGRAEIVKIPPADIHWRIIFGGARIVAFLLMIFSFVGGLGIAVKPDLHMDSGLTWGLVFLMAVIFGVGILMLRAPRR